MSDRDIESREQVLSQLAVLIPAYNEALSLGSLIREIRAVLPTQPVIIVNDGSLDRTADVARAHGAIVLDLPCNLGIGGAVQTGFRYAFENGYKYVVRLDGDGQHPPEGISTLVDKLVAEKVDMVLGSRFLDVRSYRSTFVRFLGIRGLAVMLSLICRKKVTDPTSGFFVLNRRLLYYFSHHYPTDYPEPEALALLRRQGYDFCEAGVVFRARTAGQSSINSWSTIYYGIKVGLALLVDRVRPVDRRFEKFRVRQDI